MNCQNAPFSGYQGVIDPHLSTNVVIPHGRLQSLNQSFWAVSTARTGIMSQDLSTADNRLPSEEDPSVISFRVNATQSSGPIYGKIRHLGQFHYSHTGTSPPSRASPDPALHIHSTQSSLLPDHVFLSSVGKPYDRDWMIKYGIEETILDDFSSKIKFDNLNNYDAIKVGDRLRVKFISSNGTIVKEGLILQGSKKSHPDISIAVSRPDVAFITLHGCVGPKDFIRAMNGEFQALYGDKIPGGWKYLHLISSDGRDLGSLWTVRQAYQLWMEEKERWAARNNQPRPRRRKNNKAQPTTSVHRDC